MKVTNRFKGLDLIDRVLEELWMEVRDTVQEAVIKTIPKKKKCKKAEWLSEEGLQIAEKRREAKGKTSWQIDEETMEIVTDFTFLGSKITVDSDCSHEIIRCLLLGRQATTNLDGILKSRDITLPTNVHLVKAVVFPVVMYACESWTTKKAGCQRTDAFKLWCWRTLESSLDCKEIKPDNLKGNQF